MAADLGNLVARLEIVTSRLEAAANNSGRGSSPAGDDDPLWLDDFNKIYDGTLTKFVADSKALGGELTTMADKVKSAFHHHKCLLTVAARNGRPKESDNGVVLAALSQAIIAVQSYREEQRRSKQFNHLSAISEAIPFLGWVAVSPKPAAYVQQMLESAQFYTNKVLKEFRESDPKQADWATSLMKLLKEVTEYIKDNHATGLQWNKDKPAADASSVSSVSTGGSAPPPPAPAAPGPPPPPPPSSAPAADSNKPDSSQLFAALNKGADITKGLKKVSDDMKTHKNPELRNQAPVPATKGVASTSARPFAPKQFKKFTAPETKKPPVFELQMKKWVIEHQDGNQNLVIDNTNDKQSIYMYKCKNSVLQVKGKVNSIVLDNCVKCGIVFTDLISSCEFINCQSVKAQVNGKVPTISVDKTDGIQVYLNRNNLDTQIVTAKSSEMNVCITEDDGDLKEYPLPEQYKTVYEGGKFVTTTMDLNL